MSSTNWLDLVGDDSNISMKSVEFNKCEVPHVSNSRSLFDPELDSSQQGLPLLFKKTKLIDEASNHSQLGKRSRSRMNETDNENELEIRVNSNTTNNNTNNNNNNVNTNDIFDELPPKAKQRTNEKGHWRRKKTNQPGGIASDFSRFLSNSSITNQPQSSIQTQSNQQMPTSNNEDNKENVSTKPSFADILQSKDKGRNNSISNTSTPFSTLSTNNTFDIGFGNFLKSSDNNINSGFASKETSASVLSTGFAGNLITPSNSTTPNKQSFTTLTSSNRRPVHTRRRRVTKVQKLQNKQDVKESKEVEEVEPESKAKVTTDGGTGRASDSNDVKNVSNNVKMVANNINKLIKNEESAKEESEDEDIDIVQDIVQDTGPDIITQPLTHEILEPCGANKTQHVLEEDGTRMSTVFEPNDNNNTIGGNLNSLLTSQTTSIAAPGTLIPVIPAVPTVTGTPLFPVNVGDVNTGFNNFLGTPSFGYQSFSMSNAIDLATLDKDDDNDDNNDNDNMSTTNGDNGNGNLSSQPNLSNYTSPRVTTLSSSQSNRDIPVATPHNTTSISFKHLGSLSAKKKSSASPIPPPLLPQLSTYSTGTQGSLFDMNLASLGSLGSLASMPSNLSLGSIAGMQRSKSYPNHQNSTANIFNYQNQQLDNNNNNNNNNMVTVGSSITSMSSLDTSKACSENGNPPVVPITTTPGVPVFIPAFFPSPPITVKSNLSNKESKNGKINNNNNNNNDSNTYSGPTLTTTLVNSMSGITGQSNNGLVSSSLGSCSATNVSITSSQPITNSTNVNIDDDSGNSNDNQSHNSMIDTSSSYLSHSVNITLNNNVNINNIDNNNDNNNNLTKGLTPTHRPQPEEDDMKEDAKQLQKARLTKTNSQVSNDDEPTDFVWGHLKPTKSQEKQRSDWANKLFPNEVKQNAKDKAEEEAILVEKRKQEMLIEKANRSIMPEKRSKHKKSIFNYYNEQDSYYQSPKKKASYTRKNNNNRYFSDNYNNNNNNYNNNYNSSQSNSNKTTPKPARRYNNARNSQSARKNNQTRAFTFNANHQSSHHHTAWAKKGSKEVSKELSVNGSSSRCSSMTPDNRSKSVSIMSVGPVEITDTAISWRIKQILMGKETDGYKNYILNIPKDKRLKKHPQTPDPKERIGKKRFVGKLQKWRHSLHQFDKKMNLNDNLNSINNTNQKENNNNNNNNNNDNTSQCDSIDIKLVSRNLNELDSGLESLQNNNESKEKMNGEEELTLKGKESESK